MAFFFPPVVFWLRTWVRLVARWSGKPLTNRPVLWDIESDPALAGTKLLAEAWTRRLYQCWRFVGDACEGMEWPMSVTTSAIFSW